jgi:uncharacterized membrane protein SpoIIM required for sporulation
LNKLFSLVTLEIFLLSAALFILGLSLSVKVVKKEIRFLCWYPERIWSWLKKVLEKGPGYFKLFLLIFMLNSTSLLFNVISGFGVVLPIFFGVLIGLNVGIIAYREGGIKAMVSMFIAPHAIFELPAAWLSISAGIRLGWEMIAQDSNVGLIFSQILLIYFLVILPLLLIAALLESAFIYISLKKLQHSRSLAQEPLDAQQQNRSD